MNLDKIRCNHLAYLMRWDEMSWDEMKLGEMRWDEVRWDEKRWDAMKLDEMRCNEMRCNEMRRDEMQWDAMRWGEMRWDEVRCDEIRWGEKTFVHAWLRQCSRVFSWGPATSKRGIHPIIVTANHSDTFIVTFIQATIVTSIRAK